MEDRRYFRRVKFEAEAEIRFKGKTYPAELYDISLMGALFRVDPLPPVSENDKAELVVTLPLSNITLNFTADLVHVKEKFCGFRFISKDVDTVTHLRRLLELNIGDDALVNKEIAFWLKSIKAS